MKKNMSFLMLLLISISVMGQTIYEIGYYNVNGIMGLASKSSYMILSNGGIIDNTIPATPTLVGQYSFNGDGKTVLISGDYAYFGTGMTNALFIADISNVTFPIHNSSIDFGIGSGVLGMDIKDNTLFVALGTDGILCSINITDKYNPVMLDTLYIPGGGCRDVVIKNNYAFAAHTGGLKIIDITNVSHMQLITSIGSGYNSIDVNDSLVFLGKLSGGIDVFNIYDPLNPYPAFAIPNSNGTAWDLKYNENHIYLATNSLGLFIYKIEDNAGIEMANFPNTGNGQSFGVCLQDSLILLSGLINGVAILHYDSTGNVGINPLSLKKQINIFPNPAKDLIVINQGNMTIKKIKIIDMKGKLIQQKDYNFSTKNIDISDLPVGQYIIQFETKESIITEKFIKVK